MNEEYLNIENDKTTEDQINPCGLPYKRVGDCMEYAGRRNKQGYGIMSKIDGESYAHRYAYLKKFKCIPSGMIVTHDCDNPSCINWKHLTAGTHRSNAIDRVARNKKPKTKRKRIIKLSYDLAEGIRKSKLSSAHLARLHNISRSVIINIRQGKIWKYPKKIDPAEFYTFKFSESDMSLNQGEEK